jgi:hypothetical protein
MIKAPSGQNKLVNKIFSIEGLIFVIVLTALGLSIAAFAMPCKSNFGVPGGDCGGVGRGSCDDNEWCKLDGDKKCPTGSSGITKSEKATCQAIPGNGVKVNETECSEDNYHKVSYCEPVCDNEYKWNSYQGLCQQAEGITHCNKNTCCKNDVYTGKCIKGDPNYCSTQTDSPPGPAPRDTCGAHDNDPYSCCQAKSCYFYGDGSREGSCTADPNMNISGRIKNCCEGGKYKNDGALCDWSPPGPPGPTPFPPSSESCEGEGDMCSSDHKTWRCCKGLQCVNGGCVKKSSNGGSPSSPTPMPPSSSSPPHKTGGFGGGGFGGGGIGGGGHGILNPGSRSSPSPSPSSRPPTSPPVTCSRINNPGDCQASNENCKWIRRAGDLMPLCVDGSPPGSPPGSPSGSSHDNSHLVLIISSVVGGLLLIGGGTYLYKSRGKM